MVAVFGKQKINEVSTFPKKLISDGGGCEIRFNNLVLSTKVI